MTGIVCWWPFAIVDIPNGWQICDGTNGTPDYRNYMLIGAGDLYTPGQVLGSLNHFHEYATEEALDSLDEGGDISDAEGQGDFSISGGGHDHDNYSDVISNLPPCKAGCWIMKL